MTPQSSSRAPGPSTHPPADRLPGILFVCLGNLCRSPMAEHLLKRRLAERRLDGRYRVRSAGVIAREGDIAPREAMQVAAEHGVDLSIHLSTPLTADLLAGSNLVVAMDRSNVEDILNLVPDLGPRLRLLNQFAESAPGFDVPDPMGGPLDLFRESYRQIAAAVDGLVATLAKAAGEKGIEGRPTSASDGGSSA